MHVNVYAVLSGSCVVTDSIHLRYVHAISVSSSNCAYIKHMTQWSSGGIAVNVWLYECTDATHSRDWIPRHAPFDVRKIGTSAVLISDKVMKLNGDSSLSIACSCHLKEIM